MPNQNQDLFKLDIEPEKVPHIVDPESDTMKEILEKGVKSFNIPKELFLQFKLLQVLWSSFNNFIVQKISEKTEDEQETVKQARELKNLDQEEFYNSLEQKLNVSKEEFIESFFDKLISNFENNNQ